MQITVRGGEISQKEQEKYVEYIERQINKTLTELEITLDGDFVDLHYKFEPEKFQRIRRITGYLVGTVERFNNAKSKEVEDRVKHNLNDGLEQI